MYANRKEKRRRRVGPQVIPLVCGLIEAGRKVQHPMPTAWRPTSLGGNSTFRTCWFSDLLPQDWWSCFLASTKDEGREGIRDTSAEYVRHEKAWSCQSQGSCILPGWKVSFILLYVWQSQKEEPQSPIKICIIDSAYPGIKLLYLVLVPISQRRYAKPVLTLFSKLYQYAMNCPHPNCLFDAGEHKNPPARVQFRS